MIENLLPQSSLVGRIVPKKTFIEQLGAASRMRDHFTQDVERIVWTAKLAPSTINVADGATVHEIAIFTAAVKSKDCPADVFSFIDAWMPRHILFVLEHDGQTSLLINYKELSQATTGPRFRIVRTYRTEWQDSEKVSFSLQGQSMDTIYESLVRLVAGGQILPVSGNLKKDIEETSRVEALQRNINALEKRINEERQPRKKFMLHQELQKLKTNITNNG